MQRCRRETRDDERVDNEHVRLEDAYAVVTPEDNRKLYARWAATYESDFVTDNLYVIPQRVAEVFVDVAGHLAEHATADADRLVLDVGCGTGLIGQALTRSGGQWVIDGIDISPQMLAESATKLGNDGTPIYRRLVAADLTGVVDIADGAYAGILSSGTFTHGHLGPDSLSGLIRFGRAGAHFAIGINAVHYAELGFDECLQRELVAGTICDFEPRVVEMYLPGSPHFGDTAVVAVFRRSR